jgi:hypothetical protein
VRLILLAQIIDSQVTSHNRSRRVPSRITPPVPVDRSVILISNRCAHPIETHIDYARRNGGGQQHLVSDARGHQLINVEMTLPGFGGSTTSNLRGETRMTFPEERRRNPAPVGLARTTIADDLHNAPHVFQEEAASSNSLEIATSPLSAVMTNPIPFGFGLGASVEVSGGSRQVSGWTSSRTVMLDLGDLDGDTTMVLPGSQTVATTPPRFHSVDDLEVGSVVNVAPSIPIYGSTLPPWRIPSPQHHQRRRARATGQRQGRPTTKRELFHQRLQKYKLRASFHTEQTGPQHAQLWRGSFSIGGHMVGRSSLWSSKDTAKEHAASFALAWMDQYGYK